jgi:hypothetical protein
MSRVPVFSAKELEAAFRLVLPDPEAESAARDWMDMFVDEGDLDENGMILLEEADWREAASSPITSLPPYGQEIREEDLRGWSIARKRKLLMRLSDFTLNLLAISSDDVFERIRALRDDSSELAAHRAAQMQRIVAAMAP